MKNKIVAMILVLSITVSYLSAMEPWMAASSMQSSRSMKAVPVQTPEKALKAKQAELKEINAQIPMASGSDRSALISRKKQLEKDIATMQK